MPKNYPDDLLYTKDHEWCRIDGEVATVGITFHAQSALGDVVYCSLPAEGTEVKQGAVFGAVESTKTASDLYAPVSGSVIERNETLLQKPELINSDSYGEAWMVRIRMKDKAEAGQLLSAANYVATLPPD